MRGYNQPWLNISPPFMVDKSNNFTNIVNQEAYQHKQAD